MTDDTRGTGDHALEVSTLGLGCMGMSQFDGTRDEDQAEATINHALDLGATFLDTADMYGPSTHEQLVSRAIAGRRDDVQLATKFGNERNPRRVLGAHQRHPGVRPRRERRQPSASRQRPPRPLPPAPQRQDGPDRGDRRAIAELVEAGTVRRLGLSEAGPDTVRQAHATHPRPT